MASPAGRRLQLLARSGGHLLSRGVLAGRRAVSINAEEFKDRTRADLGLWNAADTRHDRREKHLLREERPAYDKAVHARVTEVGSCISRREYEAGWEAYMSHGGEPHAALTSTALALCAKARWIQRGWEVWQAMPPEQRSVVDYSIMIDLCARCKRSINAEQLFQTMREAGLEPNLITYNSLLKAYAATSQPERALEIFQGIPREVLDAAGDKTRQACYGAVMSAFARGGDYAGTYRVFMRMLEDGVRPVIMHYTSLLTACARDGDGETADGVFASMLAAGLQPDVPAYTILVSCNRRSLDRSKQIVSEMRGRGLEPSALTQLELLDAHVSAGDGQGARELLAAVDTVRLRSHAKFGQLEAAVGQLP